MAMDPNDLSDARESDDHAPHLPEKVPTLPE